MKPVVREYRRTFTVKPFECWDKSGVSVTRKGPIPKVRGRWVRKGKDYADRIRMKFEKVSATIGRSVQRGS